MPLTNIVQNYIKFYKNILWVKILTVFTKVRADIKMDAACTFQVKIKLFLKSQKGMPPGVIPQPAVAMLGTIWYPDGSHANYDEGIKRTAVSLG